MLAIDNEVSMQEIAKRMSVSPQYISNLKRRKKYMITSLVCLLEAMGYDILVTYVRRENKK